MATTLDARGIRLFGANVPRKNVSRRHLKASAERDVEYVPSAIPASACCAVDSSLRASDPDRRAYAWSARHAPRQTAPSLGIEFLLVLDDRHWDHAEA